jgi:CheY-like chemotaxis protein
MYKVVKKSGETKYNEINNKLNILIVDDDKDTRESLCDIISSRDHNVLIIDEGYKAINKCREIDFDIIFMDYHMNDLNDEFGEVNGAEIVSMLNKIYNMKTDIFAFTGDSSKEAIDEFKKNNMTGALIKPISGELIHEIFNEIEKNKNFIRGLKKISIKNGNLKIFKKS